MFLNGLNNYILFICGFNLLSVDCDNFNWITIKPKFEFHDRRNNLIITCDANSIVEDITMIFYYNEKKNTIPRINNIHGVYVGNFSVISNEQSKVMVMCIEQSRNKMIGAKLYFLGYPPSFFPPPESKLDKIDLNCRDYNMNKVICCMSPNVTTIERSLGFEGSRKAGFNVTLLFSDSDHEIPNDKSCFDLSQYVPGPTISVSVKIANVLGVSYHNFTFNRTTIQKPSEPQIISVTTNSNNFTFQVDMPDIGEYLITAYCHSTDPANLARNLSLNMISSEQPEKVVFTDWAPNSKIFCTIRAQVLFGQEPVGQPSDITFVNVRLNEAKPSLGPFTSPQFVYYSRSDNGSIFDVTLYFANVALLNQNGDITTFRWKCLNCLYGSRYPMQQNLSNTIRYVKLKQVQIGSNLSITACTRVGCSELWTTIQFQELQDDRNSRRLSVIRSSSNPSNLTVLWFRDRGSRYKTLLLACSHQKGFDCSSIEAIEVGKNNPGMHNLLIDDSKEWKFAVVQHPPLAYHKLLWTSCIYNSPHLLEVKQKLAAFDHRPFVHLSMRCSLAECKVTFTIIAPSCENFSDLFFNEFEVSYQSESGVKVLRTTLTSINKAEFTLRGLSPGLRNYHANVSVISLTNATFFWFQHQYRTYFWSNTYIVIFIVTILFIVTIISGFLWFTIKKIKSAYFRKNFKCNDTSLITKNNYITPINLLNSDNYNVSNKVASYDSDNIDGSFNSSQGKDSTFSTSIDSSSKYNCSSDGIVNIDYTKRPHIDQYSNIVIPTIKKDKAIAFSNVLADIQIKVEANVINAAEVILLVISNPCMVFLIGITIVSTLQEDRKPNVFE